MRAIVLFLRLLSCGIQWLASVLLVITAPFALALDLLMLQGIAHAHREWKLSVTNLALCLARWLTIVDAELVL